MNVETRLPVEVESTPPGAQVRFRGELLGTTPCVVRLPAGRQELELRWPEGRSSRQVIEVDGPAPGTPRR